MMKLVVFLCLCAFVSAQFYELPNDDPHDVETLPDDVPEFEARLKCYTDKGPCSDVAAAYKRDIPDAVQTACAKCSTYLKHYYHVFIETTMKKYPEGLKDLINKYDPNGNLLPALLEAVRLY